MNRRHKMDDIYNPEIYERRSDESAREAYLKNHWQPLKNNLIKKFCYNKTVADLGCGTGTYTQIIRESSKKVIGLDASSNMIKYAKNKNRGDDFIISDAHFIPLKDNSIELVIATGLLEYVRRDVLIKEIYRILIKNEYCIVSSLNKNSSFNIIYRLMCYFKYKSTYKKEPSKAELTSLFLSNGFEITQVIMNDGLIPLPDELDKIMGEVIYSSIGKFFKFFGNNPFSQSMVIIVRKR